MIYLRSNKAYNYDINNYNNIINNNIFKSLTNNLFNEINKDLSNNLYNDISNNKINIRDNILNNNEIDDDISNNKIYHLDKYINIRYMFIINEEILNKIKMLLLENKIKKKDNKHIVINYLIHLESLYENNQKIDQYIKLTNDNYEVSMTYIKHINYNKILEEIKIYINDIEMGLEMINKLNNNKIYYFEYYITIYKYISEENIILELYKLPGIENLLIIYGNKYDCDIIIKNLDLDKEKSLNGDIRDIYIKYNIDPYKIKNFSFNNDKLINLINDKFNKI